MSTERTFSIIKPDAVERNKIGEITAMLEHAGLRVVASKRLKLDQAKASQFYEVHKERPFFQNLCDFMSSGPIVVQVLEGEDAVKRNRAKRRMRALISIFLKEKAYGFDDTSTYILIAKVSLIKASFLDLKAELKECLYKL